jgi:hypothetical protein
LVLGSAVVSTNNRDGTWSRHRTSDLAKLWANPLSGGSPEDEVWTAAYAAGHVFMSGSSDFIANAKAWMIKARTSPLAACGSHVLSDLPSAGIPSNGRRVSHFGSYLYFTGATRGAGLIYRLPTSACQPSNCAGNTSCHASAYVTVKIGTYATEVRDVYKYGSYLYAVGFYILQSSPSLDTGAFIAKINESDWSVISSKTWNPTNEMDGFSAIVGLGSTLYVGGGEKVQNNGRPALFSYDTNLNVRWTRYPSSRGGIYDVDIVTRPSTGLLLTGDDETNGVLWRCDINGNC